VLLLGDEKSLQDLVVMYSACVDYEGFPRNGFEYFMNVLIRIVTSKKAEKLKA